MGWLVAVRAVQVYWVDKYIFFLKGVLNLFFIVSLVFLWPHQSDNATHAMLQGDGGRGESLVSGAGVLENQDYTGTYIHCSQRTPSLLSRGTFSLRHACSLLSTPVPDWISFYLTPPSLTHILSNIKFEFYDDSNKLASAHQPNGFYFGGNLISISKLWHSLVIPFDSQPPYNFFLIFSFLSCHLHWG